MKIFKIIIILVIVAGGLYYWESSREKSFGEKVEDAIDDTVGDITGEGPMQRTGRKLDTALGRGKEALENLSPDEREDMLKRLKKSVGKAIESGAEAVKKQAGELAQEEDEGED